ncbi:MAG: GNAT family N-acetyltransferase [Mycobacterium sp.]|uniref:GNAT family N-acetyltransferase n=1 Tax=Mycobacterium sp. TaxID=1785 RepID=UPI003F9884A0
MLPLPPGCTDLEIGWEVAPRLWGHGYGAEAGHAVAHQAFTNVGVSEVFAVVRPGSLRRGEWAWNGSARRTSTTT